MGETGIKSSRRRSWRRLSVFAVISLVSISLLFGGAILDGFGKLMVERVLGLGRAGNELQIGDLDYSAGANRLVARSVVLRTTGTVLEIDRITLTGVRWEKLLRRTVVPADLLAAAGLEMENLDVQFLRSRSGIACARLRASVPESGLIAEGFELRTLAGDDDFFAAREHRTTRYLLAVPECRVQGLAYGEMLRGDSYRARSILVVRPSFEALVNHDKPSKPFHKPRLMLPELLATVLEPLRLDSLAITDGTLKYCMRKLAGAPPGVLTFGSVGISAEGITNRPDMNDEILLQAQGALMNAGVLKIEMTIPVASPDFTLRYSGSLGAMDVTCLGAFLERAVQTRLTSGYVQDVAFDIRVTDGVASGFVRTTYRDLEIARLDKESGEEGGLANRVASFLANVFKIRSDSAPDDSGSLIEGKVDYTRAPGDNFYKYLWRALRSGILDVVCY